MTRHRPFWFRRTFGWGFVWGGIACLVMGCDGQDPTTPVVPDPAQVFAAVEVNYKTAVLSLQAPYNTIQLQAAPINMLGDPLATTSVAEFARINVLDTSVRVDSTGLVTARARTSVTQVEVGVTVGAITRKDTVRIMVRDETPVRPIVRMEFSPLPPDSNWRWAGETTTIDPLKWVRFYDANGDVVPTAMALVHVRAQRNGLLDVTQKLREHYDAQYVIGETFLHAKTYAYGQALVDSTLFRRIDPPFRFVMIDRVVPAHGEATIAFFPGTITAKVGTTVAFMNRFGTSTFENSRRIARVTAVTDTSWLVWVDSVDIQFAAPELIEAGESLGKFEFFVSGFSGPVVSDGGSGNIPAFSVVTCQPLLIALFGGCGGAAGLTIDQGIRLRKFSVPGTYHYTSTRFPGASGTIIITE